MSDCSGCEGLSLEVPTIPRPKVARLHAEVVENLARIESEVAARESA